MLSIPPDLNYRNFHNHQPGQGLAAIDRVAATGCTAIDAYALAGLRASLEQRAAPTVVVDLPSDRRLAGRMLAAGVLQDPRIVTRGRRPSREDRYRGVPITRLSTADDVDRFAVDVLAAMRAFAPDLAPKLCASAAEIGENAVRYGSAPALATVEVLPEGGVDLVTVDAGVGIRATLDVDPASDGDALLVATGTVGGRDGGLADVARRWAAIDGAQVVLRSGHAGLVLADGTTEYEEFGTPIQGTWALVHVDKEI